MKRIIIISFMLLLCTIANAQNKLTGKITDQNKQPLIGASIYVFDMNKGTVSDMNGNYQLSDLPSGKIKVQYSSLGYAARLETLDFKGSDIELNIELVPTVIEIEPTVISGGYSSTQHENAVKIDILRLDPTLTKSSPNFTEVLSQIPGVDMISKGAGVSKPAIRGLSMNDILVLNNGVRFENYQYSSHHPLGIDEFGIENVEVIKGPASLLYGSDAIGGVLNFIKEKPAPIGSIQGDYNLQLNSNSLGITNNIGIKGASKTIFGSVRVGQKSNADYLQGGGDFVPNSRFKEHSLKTNAGFTNSIGTFKLFFDYNKQKLGLVEDEAIEEISRRGRRNEIFYQDLTTSLLSSQNKVYLNNVKLDINASYQNTELIHFGEKDAYELQMKLGTLTYEAKVYLPSNEKSEFIVGFQGINQTNTNLNDRETILLPDATINNYSVFSLLQYTFFGKLRLQTGIRYDGKNISTKEVGLASNPTSYRAPLDKSYGSFSGSAGATYNLTENLLFRTNIAAAYRTPNLAELTSNGQHELRYEVGDENLAPENAYEADLSLHYHKENFTFDIAAFYNILNNYIFISPTGDTTNTGIAIYKYKQANSALYGGEVGIHIHPQAIKGLHFEATFASVVGKQQNGSYLPFIPAHKVNLNLRKEKNNVGFLNMAYIAANSSIAFKQKHVAPDETTTPGYMLIDISIGGNVSLKNQLITFGISANNIFDKKYVDHLSTLKEVNYYNPGRNISLFVNVPFKIK